LTPTLPCKAAHKKHTDELETLEKDMLNSIQRTGDQASSTLGKLKGEVVSAVFEDRVEEESFYEILNRENQIQLVRLQALWQEHKWEGSTGFIENKERFLAGVNRLTERLLSENKTLLEWVEIEEVEGVAKKEEEPDYDTNDGMPVGRVTKEQQGKYLMQIAGGAEDRDGSKFQAAKKKLDLSENREKIDMHNVAKSKRDNLTEILLYVAFLCCVSVMMFGERDTFQGTDYFLPDNFRDLLLRTPVSGTNSYGELVTLNLEEVNTQEKTILSLSLTLTLTLTLIGGQYTGETMGMAYRDACFGELGQMVQWLLQDTSRSRLRERTE